MVTSMRFIFFFSLLSLMACGKNDFTMVFDLSEKVTENYNVTYYATDVKGGKTVQAVASVREGKCELQGFTKRKTIVYITGRRDVYPLVAVADRGEKIEFTGDTVQPLSWRVSGNPINQALSEWRIENLKTLNTNNPDSINMKVRDFVENHPGEPVSVILMLAYYDRKINEREYADLMYSLKGEAKNEEWLRIMGRADQLTHGYSYPARFQSIVMRSNKEWADTLQADNKYPVILFFWQTGLSERKEIMDSIKSIRKEFKDTVRIIADLCLDIDSIGWRNAIRRDSLDDIKRFWVPMGLTDPTIRKFKVAAVPYYIVFDKEGYQSYSGKDLGEALKDYRRLHLPTDTLDKKK